MKRKVKKFAGNEGSVVDDKYNREDEGLFGAKIKYRIDEDGRKYTAGRANPMDRASVARGDVQEQRYYSADDIKGKLSGLFGGSSEDSKSFSKFRDLESVGGDSRRPRTIEEQIGRKAEPKAEPKAETKTNSVDFSKYDTKSYTSEREGGGSTSTTGGGGRNNAPKAYKKAAAPKKDVGEDAKPLPGVQKDKDKPQNLPGVQKDKDKPKPYVAPKSNRYPAILEDNKTEEKTASEPAESGADKRKRLEAERKKQREGVLNPKKAESTSSDNKASESGANKPKKEEKRYGQGLTPYEKGKTLSEWSKMLSGGKKETAKETSKSSSKDDDEKLAATRRRAAGMFQKTNEGVYGMKKGGSVSSASSRGDGIAARGKTRGKIC